MKQVLTWKNRALPAGRPRSGAILFLVLVTGTVIAVIALGGLIAQSVYLQSSRNSKDAVQARRSVRSAFAVGIQQVAADPGWRASRPQGAWHIGVPLQSGDWSLDATDPVDADFSNNLIDPLRLAATANAGEAIQRGTSTLHVQALPHPALLYAVCAQDDVEIEDADLECAGWIGAGDRIRSSGSSVTYADVSGTNDVAGSGFQFRRRTGPTVDGVPAISRFADLAASGVAVAIGSVPPPTNSGADLILNGGFSQGTIGWSATGDAGLWHSALGGDGNSACGYVNSRTVASDALACDITGSIRNGIQMSFSGYVLPLEADAAFRVSVVVETDSGISQAAKWDSAQVSRGFFLLSSPRLITGNMTPSWTGRLKKAWLKIQTLGNSTDGTQSFVADQFGCTLTSVSAGPILYRQLVSPASNPFGVSNSIDGIYVIDCQGQDISVSDCVITSTILFQDAGTVTIGPGPVNWRPARPGLPAVVVDGDLLVSISRFAVSERELGTNFNPIGSSDAFGTSDSSLDDRYESVLSGLFYARKDITCEGDVVVRGNLMAGDDIILRQRVVVHPSPEFQTVPMSATWTFDTLARSTDDVVREFD